MALRKKNNEFKKAAYTICSANYLPFAKSLGDSLISYNEDYIFFIVLLEKNRKYNLELLSSHEIVFIEDLEIDSFENMNDKYSIFELSCALKPFVALSLLKKYNQIEKLFYFDSDILVFNSLNEVEKKLDISSVVLTPHITSPIENDGLFPNEHTILRSGLYNGGFFGLKNNTITLLFIDWWKNHLLDKCYNDLLNGFFVDQIWLNFAPILFKEVHIFLDLSYNVAYWNFHERKLINKNNVFNLEGSGVLTFFHYSGYEIDNPEIISKHQNKYNFDVLPEYRPIFDFYRDRIIANKYEEFHLLTPTCGFIKKEFKKKKSFNYYIKKIFRIK